MKGAASGWTRPRCAERWRPAIEWTRSVLSPPSGRRRTPSSSIPTSSTSTRSATSSSNTRVRGERRCDLPGAALVYARDNADISDRALPGGGCGERTEKGSTDHLPEQLANPLPPQGPPIQPGGAHLGLAPDG